MAGQGMWVLGLIVSAYFASVAYSVLECTDLIPKVEPCQGFVLGSDDQPNPACCTALSDLEKSVAASQPDRKALCECLKQVAAFLPIDFDKANQLPKLCHLTINITVSPDLDCNKF